MYIYVYMYINIYVYMYGPEAHAAPSCAILGLDRRPARPGCPFPASYIYTHIYIYI